MKNLKFLSSQGMAAVMMKLRCCCHAPSGLGICRESSGFFGSDPGTWETHGGLFVTGYYLSCCWGGSGLALPGSDVEQICLTARESLEQSGWW